MYRLDFNPELGYAQLEDGSTGIRVGTILQDPGRKRPSVIGMAYARYSRSDKSMPEILEELTGKDSAERIGNIAFNYGHASVAGLAHTNVFVEDVSILDHLQFFYTLNVIDGQARSSRYQDYSKPRYMAVPSTYGTDEVRNEYKRIITKQIRDYSEMLDPTKRTLATFFNIDESDKNAFSALHARSLDCVRYFIPMGIKDSFGGVVSARELGQRYIPKMLGSLDPVSKRLGELTLDLLSKEKEGYIPEVDTLMRHTDPKPSATKLMVDYVSSNGILPKDSRWTYQGNPEDNVRAWELRSDEALMFNLSLLADPQTCIPNRYEARDVDAIADILFSIHSHHNEMGKEAHSGSFTIQGIWDMGSIKDFIRHRSTNNFVPLLHEECNMWNELDREERKCFYIPPYFHTAEMVFLADEYTRRLKDTYSSIKQWYINAISCMPIEVANYYVKRLLPQAHATQILMSGSIADFSYLTHLRIRNGGHIQYRLITHAMVKALSSMDRLWQPLLSKLAEPDAFARDQFIDRS